MKALLFSCMFLLGACSSTPSVDCYNDADAVAQDACYQMYYGGSDGGESE